MTDRSGTVVWRWQGDAFGQTLPDEDPDGDGTATSLDLRFPGQLADRETGTHYNYFRDYDPRVARYLETDPIGLQGGTNTFGYALQNPNSNTDATGLISESECKREAMRRVEACRRIIGLNDFLCTTSCRALKFAPRSNILLELCMEGCESLAERAHGECSKRFFRELDGCRNQCSI